MLRALSTIGAVSLVAVMGGYGIVGDKVDKAAMPAGPTTTVQGQLYRQGPYGRGSAPGIAVRLLHRQHGPSAFAYSGQDGMYALYNVPVSQSQSDTYTLEIWVTRRTEDVMRFPIVAYPQEYTNIAPIRVP